MTAIEYTEPGPERAYEQDEPGYPLGGYLHHVQALFQEFEDGLRHAEEQAKGNRLFPYGSPADVRFRIAAERFGPPIRLWEAELLGAAARLQPPLDLRPLLK